jgi:hypothetical protein
MQVYGGEVRRGDKGRVSEYRRPCLFCVMHFYTVYTVDVLWTIIATISHPLNVMLQQKRTNSLAQCHGYCLFAFEFVVLPQLFARAY